MKIIAILSVVLLLSGCATVYQSQSMTSGFSETQLDTDVFTVKLNSGDSIPINYPNFKN
jgi:uncharacterized protein YceK